MKGNSQYTSFYKYLLVFFKTTAQIVRMVLALFVMLITWYTFITFFGDPGMPISPGDLFFYFLPTLIMLTILGFGWHHERFEGLAILLVSFGFLLIYNVYLSLAVFVFLLFIGGLLLTDYYRLSHRSTFI